MKLYALNFSPPSRAVWLVLELLDCKYEFIRTHPGEGSTKTPEYLKMNPQHTIPVLVDGDVVINESRAAMAYLATKYGKSHKYLYPSDLKRRSLIEQRLFFCHTRLWPKLFALIKATLSGKLYDDEIMNPIKEALQWITEFVKPSGFVAGGKGASIADISMLPSYSTLRHIGLISAEDFPELEAWSKRVAATFTDAAKYEKANGSGSAEFGGLLKGKIEAMRAA